MRNTLWVIKVGGSLLDWPELPRRLIDYLDELQSRAPEARPLLIAGGGPPADWVRQRDADHRFSDEAAHQLAIHAMDLSARMLAALLPGSIIVDQLGPLERPAPAERGGPVPIVLPSAIVQQLEDRGAGPLPRSWGVTSDSIAAWTAAHLKARALVLLKSASAPRGAGRAEAARAGLVDPYFPRAAAPLEHVELLNLRRANGPGPGPGAFAGAVLSAAEQAARTAPQA